MQLTGSLLWRAGAALLSVTDKSRMGSDDQRRYTLISAEATEFKWRADREMGRAKTATCCLGQGRKAVRVHKAELARLAANSVPMPVRQFVFSSRRQTAAKVKASIAPETHSFLAV
jgi:hypothetical protein